MPLSTLLACTLLLLSEVNIACSEISFAPNSKTKPFISHLISTYFSRHRIFLMFADFVYSSQRGAGAVWEDNFVEIAATPEIISNSGGVLNTKVGNNQTEFYTMERPPRSTSELTQVIILILPGGVPSKNHNQILRDRLNLPLLAPPTVKNMDKYIIFTSEEDRQSLYESYFFNKIKWKLVLTERKGELVLHHFCPHCPIPEATYIHSQYDDFSHVSNFFPDFQRNFYGHVLKASATDKMYGDLEFAKDPVTGKDYAKRGIFAIVLRHLAQGLNFTGETFRASGGGSTGTPFPNGSWVGSVGDVYYGDANFCMLCSISLSRHRVIDMCMPVTYEYVRFAIGPPDKLYTPMSLFWPFDLVMWFTILFITAFTSLCCYAFLKYNVERVKEGAHPSSWTVISVARYFLQMLIEQGDDIPGALPETIKIIIGYWLLFALVITTIYRAKMVTFMTFPILEPAPEDFDQLVKSPYDIEFHYFPNIAYNSFRLSTNPVYKAVFAKLIKETDPVKCMQHTLERKAVCIMFTSVHDDTINRNMSDRFGQTPIKAAPGYAYLFSPGIVLEKMADIYDNFKWILTNSLQMGLNEYWQRSDSLMLLQNKNNWVKSIPPDGDRSAVFQYEDDTDDVLHLTHLKGAYAIWGVGLLAALIGFMYERIKFFSSSLVKSFKRHKQARANLFGAHDDLFCVHNNFVHQRR